MSFKADHLHFDFYFSFFACSLCLTKGSNSEEASGERRMLGTFPGQHLRSMGMWNRITLQRKQLPRLRRLLGASLSEYFLLFGFIRTG